MIVAALVLTLTAGATDLKVAAMGFRAVGTDEQKGEFYSDFFAQKLGAAGGFPVTTTSQVSALIGLERQKALLGCSDAASSCLAEMAGALGVQAVVSGSIAQIGQTYAVTVKVTATDDAREIVSASQTLPQEEAILSWMQEQAQIMGPKIRRHFGVAGDAPAEIALRGESGGLRGKAWIPAVVGGVALAGAGALLFLAKDTENKMLAAPSAADAEAIAETGKKQVTGVTIATAVGVAALATAAAFAFWPDSSSGSVSVIPTEHGALASFGGTF